MRRPVHNHRDSANSLFSSANAFNTTCNTTTNNDYGSPGITHSSKVKYDISSIDKIHDDNRNKLLVITGKQHLALYKILDETNTDSNLDSNESTYKASFINKPKVKPLQKIILMKDLLHNTNSSASSNNINHFGGHLPSDSFSNLNNNISVSIPESVINNSFNVNNGSISPAGSFKFLNKSLNTSSLSQSPSSSSFQQQLPHLSLQSRNNSTSSVKLKSLATNSDVKSGYKEFNHLVAVTNTSTTVSLYDINRFNTNSLFATIQEHNRTINSVDFHPQNASSFLAGDMNGIAKIYDLRKLSSATKNLSSSSTTISQMNHRTVSDLTITTQQNDAIRDIKWNPSDSNIFATIHDSGTILKYDIRYTAVPEKKISAHDGPGLCIHWVPPHQNNSSHLQNNNNYYNYNNNTGNGSGTLESSDYLASGGRDGKLCYWYMGDSRPSLGIPDRTVVVGEAIHKLKFRPIHNSPNNNNINNNHNFNGGKNGNNPVWSGKQQQQQQESSLGQMIQNGNGLDDTQVAISTNRQQMNNNITIYSPSRIYMPKHILATRASSTGFVWFDDNHIFNIDKKNCINGFDLRKEPLMEENVGGKGLKWRDIEGDGLVFSMPFGVPSRYMPHDETDKFNKDTLLSENQLEDVEEDGDDVTMGTPTKRIVGQLIEQDEKRSGTLSLLDRSATNSPVSSLLRQRGSLLRPASTCQGSPNESSSQTTGPNNSHNSFLMNLKNKKKMQQQQQQHPYNDSFKNSPSHSHSPKERGNTTPAVSPFQQLLNAHSNWNSVTSHNSHQSHNPSISTALTSNSIMAPPPLSQSLIYALNIPLIMDKLVPPKIYDSLSINEDIKEQIETDIKISKIAGAPVETFKYLAKNLAYANISFAFSISSSSNSNVSTERRRKSIGRELERKEKLEREKIINDLGFHDDWLATAETHTKLEACSGVPHVEEEKQNNLDLNQENENEKEEVEEEEEEVKESEEKNIDNESKKIKNDEDVFLKTEIKVSMKDYEKLFNICQHNADVYAKINDLSKSKIWSLIQKSISFHMEELETKYIKKTESEKENNSDSRVNSNEEAIVDDDFGIDDDDEENFLESNTDLESQSSLSKSGSFVSSLKHRASSSNNFGNKFEQSIVPIKYEKAEDDNDNNQEAEQEEGDDDDEESDAKKNHLKKKKLTDPSSMTELQTTLLQNNKPWALNNILPYFFKQCQKTGDLLTASLLLLSFQQLIPLTPKANAKSAIYDFICILHTYELFEVSAQLLKSCFFAKDILSMSNNNANTESDSLNDSSAQKNSIEEAVPSDGESVSMIIFDQSKIQNKTCVFCEGRITKNTIMLLKCGHIGHTPCLSTWFSSMGCLCPAGCIGKLI